jgi:hypothetical protein
VTTSCVKTICDVVFDETNGSQKEQVDLDLADVEEALCDSLERMMVDDVRPHDLSNQAQETFLNVTTSLAQGLDQDNYEEDDKPNDRGQEESNDQGKDEDDEDRGDHPVVNILGDIENGVITRSHVTNFYEHYSFVSSLEPFKVWSLSAIKCGFWLKDQSKML